MQNTSKNLSKFVSGSAMASSTVFWLRHWSVPFVVNTYVFHRKSRELAAADYIFTSKQSTPN